MSTRVEVENSGRRDVIKVLVGGGLAATLGCASNQRPAFVGSGATPRGGAALSPSSACIERPAQTEGPYFVDEKLTRSDIRADPMDGSRSPGVPLELVLAVHRSTDMTCSPLGGVLVDVWHCDAAGIYSDVVDTDAHFDTSGKKFLRGNLLTDARGVVRFTTIYPGWYPGRTPHIHFKIRARLAHEKVHELTSQLYFDDQLSNRVYEHAPYRRRGVGNVTNASDFVYRRGGDRLLLDVTKQGPGYRAAFAIGLRVP